MNKLIPLAILLSLCLFGSVKASQEASQKTIPPVALKPIGSNNSQQKTIQPQQITVDFPSTLNLQTSGKLDVNSAENQKHTDTPSSKWTDPLSISTILLVIVTGGLVLLARYQLRTTQTTTRAYVRISSCSPGIVFFDRTFPPPAVACKLEIKNYGETPAHITDIIIHAYKSEVRQLLPYPPDFTGAKRYKCSSAFLVRGESIFYQFYDEAILNKMSIEDIKGEKVILNLYGYVDYTDAFGKCHRGGFGQNYYAAYDDSTKYTTDEFPRRNNLTFLMQAGYNYDRQRKGNEDKEKPINN
jgi:hypothetical protein